jgi:hypothetical protein
MKSVKILAVVIGVVFAVLLTGYFSTISTMPLGQPRLLRFGHTRVLMETVPSHESGWWSQPVYAETARNGVLQRVVAGHTVRLGRLNFFAVGR